MQNFTLSDMQAFELQKTVLPIFTIRNGIELETIGTCWIVSAQGDWAIGITATHVADYIVRREERHETSAPNMPDIFRSPKPPAVGLQVTRTEVLIPTSPKVFETASVQRFIRDGAHDLAICEISVKPDSKVRFDRSIRIQSGPVLPGTGVHIGGYTRLRDTSSTLDARGKISGTFCPEIQLRAAKVTGSYIQRGRGTKGPCFDVDASSEPGMSGGPVFLSDDEDGLVACGIVSSGVDYQPETTCSNLWPMYGTDLDFIKSSEGVPMSLLDMAVERMIFDRSDPQNHFRRVRRDEDGGGAIGWC
jgi:Trypsin-like peptidase domain